MTTTHLRTDIDTLNEAAILMALYQNLEDLRLRNGGDDLDRVAPSFLDKFIEKIPFRELVETLDEKLNLADKFGFRALSDNAGNFGAAINRFRDGVLARLIEPLEIGKQISGQEKFMQETYGLIAEPGYRGTFKALDRQVRRAAALYATCSMASAGAVNIALEHPHLSVGISMAIGFSATYLGALIIGKVVYDYPSNGRNAHIRRGQNLIEKRLNEIMPQLPGIHGQRSRIKLKPTSTGLSLAFYKDGKLDNPYGPALVEMDRKGNVTKAAYLVDGRPVARQRTAVSQYAAVENELSDGLTDFFYAHARARVDGRIATHLAQRPIALPAGTQLFTDFDSLDKAITVWMGRTAYGTETIDKHVSSFFNGRLDNVDMIDILKVRLDLTSLSRLTQSDGRFVLDQDIKPSLTERILTRVVSMVDNLRPAPPNAGPARP